MVSYNSFYFSSPSSILMHNVNIFNDFLLMILMGILISISFFMTYELMIKDFNHNWYENHHLEFLWTLIPMVILIMIVFPSTFLLYFSDSCLFCGFTIFILGHQWYWSYFYKDLNNFSFDSYMTTDNKLFRLLEVDNRVMVPFNFPLRFLSSSADVIHSWTVPSLGIKMDAVPGRINQYCTSFSRSGLFFGQCSEICGINHSFMPIVLESLSFKDIFIFD